MRKVLEELYWNGNSNNEMSDDGTFAAYYNHLVTTLIEGLSIYCKSKRLHMPELDNELIRAIIGQLQEISLRVLILEMQLANQCRELVGEDEVAKYVYYAQHTLMDRNYLREMYEVYPEMYNVLFHEMETNIQNCLWVLEAYERDKNDLNNMIFPENPCNSIVWIGGGDSDSHNGGRRVYWIMLDNGERLVYKPRCLAIDKAFQAFVKSIGNGIGLSYHWNKVLDKGEYGWCEWVDKKTCKTRKQLENYYFRNGILLCVSYLLGAEDMHYENLIANGEYPILVDLEMGLGSRGIKSLENNGSEIERIYLESVLHTGLLPLYTWNENGEGVNVGAMNGTGGQLCPIKMPVVAQAGTVDMHIEYRQPKMGEGKNLATLNGEFVEPYEFLEHIQNGFECAYRVMMNDKISLIEQLDKFFRVPVRYLVRETQQYAMMLNSSYNPKCLTHKKERQDLIRYLNRGADKLTTEKEWICIQEETEMYNGDVPYFWYDAWSRNLYSGTGECCTDYFPVPVICCVKDRLNRMDEQELTRQKKFIRNALLIGTKQMGSIENIQYETHHKPMHNKECQLVDYDSAGLQVAEWVGDILLDEAIWSEDKQSVGWISIIMAGYLERGYLMRPMNHYLYDGLAGVAVFMVALAQKSESDRFNYLAETLIRQLFAYTDKLYKEKCAVTLPTGAFSGEASLVYAYILLYEMTNDAAFLRYLRKHGEIVAQSFGKDSNYDILGGNAGAVLVMLRAFKLTREQLYLDWAIEAGNEMIKSATHYEWGIGWVNAYAGKALTGFAHGASGMVLAFSMLGYFSGNKKYYEMAYSAFLFEQHYFLPEIGDWEDLRYDQHAPKQYDLAWCHGRGGILAAYHIAEKYADDKLRADIQKVTSEVKMTEWANKNKNALCLCHGRIGNIGLFYAVGEKARAEIEYEKTVRLLLMNGKEGLRSLLQLQECDNFGLLGGITGIGYGCICKGEKLLMIEK